jgi:hypothetical protein
MQAEQRPVSRKGRSAILYGLALTLGVCMAVTGFLVTDYKFIILPLLGFGLSLGFNVLTQYSVCSRVKISQTITLANFALVGTLLALTLQRYIGALSSPIRSLFPRQPDEFINQFSAAFYLFWAGAYAHIAAGGFLQTCPSAA